VGRKAIGPVIMDGGVVRQMDTLNTIALFFLERMGFFYQILAEDHGRKPVGESVPLKQMKEIV
jgi:hypothetical protein